MPDTIISKDLGFEAVHNQLGEFFKGSIWLRRIFYWLLDKLLLRSWYVRREVRSWGKEKKNEAQHILDAGSGFGQYSYMMSRKSPRWNVLALDLRPKRVCECNAFFQSIGRRNVLCRIENLETLHHTNTFDLVLSVETLKYIEDDRLVLSNFHRSMKADAEIIIIVPTGNNADKKPLDSPEQKSHVQVREGYIMRNLKNKMQKAGFKQIQGRYFRGPAGQLSYKLGMRFPAECLIMNRYLFWLLPLYYLAIFPICFLLNFMDISQQHKDGDYLLIRARK